jgi:hypothetical protein
LGLVYGFVGILQTAALYFAFKISKVKVKGLNDSKYTTAVVYIITITVIILAITSLVFKLWDYRNASASIYGSLIWMAGTSILGLVFIPKVIVCIVLLHMCNAIPVLMCVMINTTIH